MPGSAALQGIEQQLSDVIQDKLAESEESGHATDGCENDGYEDPAPARHEFVHSVGGPEVQFLWMISKYQR